MVMSSRFPSPEKLDEHIDDFLEVISNSSDLEWLEREQRNWEGELGQLENDLRNVESQIKKLDGSAGPVKGMIPDLVEARQTIQEDFSQIQRITKAIKERLADV